MKSGPGYWIAAAALLTNGPRLVLAFLEADGLVIGADVRSRLLHLTGWATAIVLTGGGAFLAHEAARAGRGRGLLVVCWLAVLLFSGLIIPPVLVTSLAASPLAAVLSPGWPRWAWACLAVLAVEVIAAGAMLAEVRRRQELQLSSQLELELCELRSSRAELSSKLAAAEHQLEQQLRDGAGEQSTAQLARTPSRPVSTPRAVPDIPCRNGCGQRFRSGAAERGHQRACARRGPAAA